MKRFFFLAITLFLHCQPINNDILKKESLKTFVGFLNGDTFQVRCEARQNENLGFAEVRKNLLDDCRKYLVVTLAKFKIAYDYNVSIGYIVQRNPGEHNFEKEFEKEFGYSAGMPPSKITDVSQIKATFSREQIDKLSELYSEYFPGKITREWTSNGTLNFLYVIRHKGLIYRIKNTKMPFAIQF